MMKKYVNSKYNGLRNNPFEEAFLPRLTSPYFTDSFGEGTMWDQEIHYPQQQEGQWWPPSSPIPPTTTTNESASSSTK